MPKFGVTSKKESELLMRMATCGIEEKDLEEKFIRSGGPGGQHVNRSATCVYIRHSVTGLEVKMQQSRSQGLNRFYARRRLCELIEEADGTRKSNAEIAREKIRKQKARRRKRTKNRDEPSAGESDVSPESP